MSAVMDIWLLQEICNTYENVSSVFWKVLRAWWRYRYQLRKYKGSTWEIVSAEDRWFFRQWEKAYKDSAYPHAFGRRNDYNAQHGGLCSLTRLGKDLEEIREVCLFLEDDKVPYFCSMKEHKPAERDSGA